MVDREKIASVILDGMKAQMTAMPGPAGHAFSADAGTLDLGKIADAVIATLASNPVDRAEAERLLDAFQSAVAEDENVAAWDNPPKRATLTRLTKQYNETRAAVLAAMTIPEGFRLVPVEPTPAQLRAAASAFNEAPLHSLDGSTLTQSEWRALLSPFDDAPEVPK